MPAWAWSSLAAAQRVRSVPKAAARRGAQTAPAPGKLAKSSWSGWAAKTAAIWPSKVSMASSRDRSWVA